MISFIVGAFLIIWCVGQRSGADGKVEGQPLGMPKGTIRALITLMIVSFPFYYLLTSQEIPGIINSAIFLIVAFYFEARKGGEDRTKQIVKGLLNPEKYQQEKEEKKPLYLPKYTVRVLLVLMLALIVIINALGPNLSFVATNSLTELFLIIVLFIIGSFFKAIGTARLKKRIHSQVTGMQDFKTLSKYEILEKLMEQKPSWWKQKGESFLSLVTLIAVITALVLFTFDVNIMLLTLPFYELQFRDTLLLLISIYYGLRD